MAIPVWPLSGFLMTILISTVFKSSMQRSCHGPDWRRIFSANIFSTGLAVRTSWNCHCLTKWAWHRVTLRSWQAERLFGFRKIDVADLQTHVVEALMIRIIFCLVISIVGVVFYFNPFSKRAHGIGCCGERAESKASAAKI